MSASSKKSLLEDEINLLIKHFGVKRVQNAIAKASWAAEGGPQEFARRRVPSVKRSIESNGNRDFEKPLESNGNRDGTRDIDAIRETYPEKHRVLSDFLLRLKGRQVLPESQDIRLFAQMIGLKEINGKSREDLLPKLIRFLAEQPIEKLRTELGKASNISEKQRQLGFSVLTDKLIGGPLA